jgi:hypothetical protein
MLCTSRMKSSALHLLATGSLSIVVRATSQGKKHETPKKSLRPPILFPSMLYHKELCSENRLNTVPPPRIYTKDVMSHSPPPRFPDSCSTSSTQAVHAPETEREIGQKRRKKTRSEVFTHTGAIENKAAAFSLQDSVERVALDDASAHSGPHVSLEAVSVVAQVLRGLLVQGVRSVGFEKQELATQITSVKTVPVFVWLSGKP